ncbi:serine hydrolase domain-containing protein [Bacillus manliponensis]|uniref:serine hydrolase domain-containing protein n=1 Tax=Bacillus manliponensis TaxID=574376 RepID=UPI003514F2E1
MDFQALESMFKEKNIHAFLVHQHGERNVTYYKEEACKEQLHKINSITKSIVAILIGIALEKRFLCNVHTPITKWIPNVPKEKEGITLYHLLTMTTGEDWHEFGKGAIFPNDFAHSDNWIDYILQTPVAEEQGLKMNYNSGSSHLLSYILQKATGMTTEMFAKKYLFEPLQIEEYEWQQDPQGLFVGGFGMKMKAEDLLKIGVLCLQNGRLNGEELISEDWMQESTIGRFKTYDHIASYGYHWWVLDPKVDDIPYYTYFAMGYGGQYIIVIPQLELTVVISSHMPKRGLVPLKAFLKHIKEFS